MLIDPSELLFRERLAPITSSMGFLNTELSHAADELGAWLNEQKGGRITSVERKEVEGDLEAVLKSLVPLSKGMSSKKLLIPTIGE